MVAVVGALSAWFAVRWSSADPVVGSAHGGWLLRLGLLGLACLAEVGYVRLRHGESTEDLTFFEAVLVAAALLLPVLDALTVALGGLFLAGVVMRRPLVKTAFNLGSYATGASALVLLTHFTASSDGALGPRAVIGVVVGSLAFAAVNLIALCAVLGVVERVDVIQMVHAEWQLSTIMAVGNAGAGMLAVEIGRSVPALLPFVMLPVLTLAHSYRSAVRQAEEKERNHWLAALGTLLAGQRDGELLLPAAETIRGLFGADVVHIEVEPSSDGATETVAGAQVLLRQAAPEGCVRAVAVPLELEAPARGSLVVGWTGQTPQGWWGRWRSGESVEAQLSTLVGVGTAVSNAVRAAKHLEALTEESSKLQAVVNHGTDGMAVLTAAGEILIWSPAMSRLTGVDVFAESADAHAWDLAAGDDDPVVALLTRLGGADARPDALRAALAPGHTEATVEISVRTEHDERRSLEISVRQIEPDAPAGRLTVVTARDVTEAARLERLKADFIASVSHELRTPITPIKGYAQLLITRGHLMEPARRLHALQLIEDRADHLSRLVDDLLLASRVGGDETPDVAIEPVTMDLRTVIAKSMAGQEVLVDRTTTTLPEHAVWVQCDSVRAVQCLSNLLSNAVKYSPAESPIHVEVAETESVASVSVTDWGRGIPAAEVGRVFDRFHRVDDAFTMSTSGSGLGLYIARELARAMGGDLTLVSRFGSGSTFTLSLPRPGAPSSPEPTHSEVPRPRRIPEEARP